LEVDIGAGNAVMDLTALEITKLEADSGSGRLEVSLPGGDFPVSIGSGSGSISIKAAEGSELDLDADVGSGRITIEIAKNSYGRVDLDSGSGGITVIVPEGLAMQVSGDTGSGSVSVPRDFVRTSGDDGLVGDSGTWESPEFSQADDGLFIRFDVGSGSLRVQYQ
jgi:DUF4097 and DUF4098 domain-containing protein YvlB